MDVRKLRRTVARTPAWGRSSLIVIGLISRSHQSGLIGDNHQLGPVASVKLRHDTANVGLSGRRADEQASRDLSVGQPASDQGEDLTLPLGEVSQPLP